MENRTTLSRSTVAYALLLIVGGALGLLASFSLTMDKFAIMADPDAVLTCSLSSVVSCNVNLGSWQGAVFWGIPNPIWGLMMFVAPVAVGVALLAGARFRPWFWWLFTAGMTFAISFVYWLAMQSIFNLKTLCPWCALVYVVVIPMWVTTVMATLRNGSAGERARAFAAKLGTFVPAFVAVLGLLLIFGLAQLELGVIESFFV